MVRSTRPIRRVTRKSRHSVARPRASTALRKTIKKVVVSMAEIKGTNDASLNINLTSANITQLPFIAKVIPNLSLGSDTSERDGNMVNFQSISFRGSLSVRTNDEDPDSAFPTHVRIMVVSQKKNTIIAGTSYGNFPTVTEVSTLFEDGSSFQNFQGNIMDMYRRVNKDTWTQHYSRVYKLGRNDGIYSNNDYKLQRDININISKSMLGKVLYNDVNSHPTNKQFWLMAQVVKFDGSATGVAFSPVELSYTRQTRYVDL